MKIDDLSKLKFTSIKYGGDIIHFKYDNEHYILENGGTEMTLVIRLSKGRMKCHLEPIKSRYGMIRNLIEYKNNKKTLSSINKQNFVNKLVEFEILEPTQEQKEAIKQQKIKEKIQQIEKIKQEIFELKNS